MNILLGGGKGMFFVPPIPPTSNLLYGGRFLFSHNFNHFPLKSHIKYIHISPFLTHLSMRVFHSNIPLQKYRIL